MKFSPPVKKKWIRIIPYPPNFKRIPAKIIDPETGASTWALGSHKWTRNIGNFTRNAINIDILYSQKFLIDLFTITKEYRNIFCDPPILTKLIIINSKGNDANRV